MAGVGIIDVDRQKAAFIVMRIEQRQLLMAMHDIGGVVDIEGDRLGRATVTLAPQLYHGSHQSYLNAHGFLCEAVVVSDDRLAQEPMCIDRTPQRPLSGDAHGIRRHCQSGNAEALKMPRPRLLIGKLPLLVRGQSLDERSRQGMFAHI